MGKKVILLFVLFFVLLGFAPSHAYELMSGPTQLIQYNASKAYEGYTLIISGGKVCLIDMLGYVVHTWENENVSPGMHFVLLENGHILGNTRGAGAGGQGGMPPGGAGGQGGMAGRAGGRGGMAGGAGGQGGMAGGASGRGGMAGGAGGAGGRAGGMAPQGGMPGGTGGAGGQGGMQGGAGSRGGAAPQGGMPGGTGGAGGQGGMPGGAGGGMAFGGAVNGLAELDWDGNIVWQYQPGEGDGSLHHDFHRMPNGNTLTNAWETIPYEEVIAAGRLADQTTERGLAVDVIYEIDPEGNIVWKWSTWDHRGSNSKFHLDVNYITHVIPEYSRSNPDWTHFNNVTYDPETDRILTDSREFSEIYIIDHKTGDILYRWGNPSAYGAGEGPTLSTNGDQVLFGQHDAQWIDDGLPGAGNILIFNNGWGRSPTSYSSIVEMDPETDEIVWEYSRGFSSSFISGCQRLPNGNTLVCSGNHGHLFEVTSEGEVVWEYVVSTSNWSGASAGAGGGGLFRAHRYGPDYPGLAGKDLKPQGQVVEDVKGGWVPRVDLTGATQAGAKLWKKLWK